MKTSNKDMEVIKDKKRGLIAGYKPNRISLYIVMLTTGRTDELLEVLKKDMEKYKLREPWDRNNLKEDNNDKS